MEKENCPVCNYAISTMSYCERCAWDLSENIYWLGATSVTQQALLKRLEVAKKNWEMVRFAEAQQHSIKKIVQAYRLIEQELKILKSQHPQLKKDIDQLLKKVKSLPAKGTKE